jgi:hypothetical protein
VRSPALLGPHVEDGPLGYFSRAATPRTPYPNPSRPRAPPLEPLKTLARLRRRSSPSLLLRRQGAAPELRKKVRMTPVLLVVELVDRSA